MNNKLILLVALFLCTLEPAIAQRGGDRGDRGGDRGDRGGWGRGGRGGGGFDPSSFLDRLDSNNNGILDPDEQQGPAQFLIRRLQSSDSSIEAGKPIPIQKIRDGFEQMRSGRSRGDSGNDNNNNNNDSRRSSGGGNNADDPALQAELLVPGFGSEEALEQVLGFGPKAELMTATVTDADRKEASETLARYDRNRNQYVDKDEITRRFAGNPLDFDRNQDGRLSLDELAVRYARRREAKSNQANDNQSAQKSNRGKTADTGSPDLFGGRRSYRSAGRSESTEGLPGYFSDRDRNGDGQISMAEFMQEAPQDWNDADVEKFFDTDFNEDGVITKSEALRSIEEGPASALRARLSGQTAGNNSATSTSNASASNSAAAANNSPIDKKYSDLAKRIIGRYDKNSDGVLTLSEWKVMLMNPGAADANRDGKITADEYARWTVSRGSGS